VNILALDTCLGAVSAAVRWQTAGGEGALREAYETRATGHAERLFPMIDEVLGGAGLDFADIDRIAVTLGPGTFTGVRAGVAAARGFALASGKPVVGMGSLAIMAHRANLLIGRERVGRALAVAVDARRGALYFQLFAEDLTAAGDVLLATPETAAEIIGQRPVLAVGSGAVAVAAAAGKVAEARLPDLQPHARFLALLAAELTPLDTIRPLYLRQPDAKPQADQGLPPSPP
jgi:tRNA threonylcarbamoyladenosine biosynthesis protein TsaB